MPPEEIFKKVILVLVVLFVFVLIRNIYRTYKYCGINPKCYWKNKYYVLGTRNYLLTPESDYQTKITPT
jgi:F0F1-type ATP synthase membrane subunit a